MVNNVHKDEFLVFYLFFPLEALLKRVVIQVLVDVNIDYVSKIAFSVVVVTINCHDLCALINLFNQFVPTHGERVKPDILKNRFEMKIICGLTTIVLVGLSFTQFSAVGKLTN